LDNIKIGLSLNAKDNATPVVRNLFGRLKEILKQPLAIGIGAGILGDNLKNISNSSAQTAMTFVKPFAALEDAKTQLENTLMKDSGKVSSWFKAIDKEATELGNKLPGTTADFYQMASAMKALGVSEQTIVKGGLKTAAYLGVVLKVPYEEAAQSVAKFKNALKIDDKDLMPFMDQIQRMVHTGARLEDLKYVFTKLSGTLNLMGLTGLENSKKLAPLAGMLLSTGTSGEIVGTAMSNMLSTMMTLEADQSKKATDLKKMLKMQGVEFDFVDDKGKFKGLDNALKELQKIDKIKSDDKKLIAIEAIWGKGEEGKSVATFYKESKGGIGAYIKKLEEQATLQERVNNSLKTLGNLWDAFKGTKDNIFASVVETWSVEIHNATKWLGTFTSKVGEFAKTHPQITKWFGGFVLGIPVLAGVAAALLAPIALLYKLKGALSIFGIFKGGSKAVCELGDCAKKAGVGGRIFSGILKGGKVALMLFGGAAKFASRAVLWLGRAFLLNPIGLAITAIGLGAYLIYRNWSKIKPWFGSIWNSVKNIFNVASNWMKSLITNPINIIKSAWSKIKPWFGSIWNALKIYLM